MKRIIKLVSVTIMLNLLVGCTTGDDQSVNGNMQSQEEMLESVQYYDAYATIDSDDVYSMPTIVEMAYSNIYDESDAVALVTVLSIDGGSNINETTDGYTYPYTHGNLLVQAVYRGDIKPNEKISYTRMGGIIPYQSYYEALRPEEIASHQELSLPYVKEMFCCDIDIEVGTTYLVYMKNTEEHVVRNDHYSIVGWESGLREVRLIDNQDTFQSAITSQIEVYSNGYEEWENLEELLSQQGL